VGQSGSGPTAWALYPSLADAESAAEAVRAAVDDGRVATLGDEAPSIIATTLASSREGS
jgi:hypothetical protein